MPDWFLLASGIATVIATIVAVMAAVGFVDPSQPRCRRCRRDVRSFAWRTPCTCECGADLARSNAVRGKRRRRRWLVVVALVAIALCAGLVATAHRLRAEGGQWRDLLPAGTFGRLLGMDPSEENRLSLGARLDRGVSAGEARALIAGVLASPLASNPAGAEDLSTIVGEVIGATPPGTELPDGAADAVLDGQILLTPESIDGWRQIVFAPDASSLFSGFLDISRITIDGTDVEWRALGPGQARVDRWIPFVQDVRIEVREGNDAVDNGTAQAARVEGRLAIVPGWTMPPGVDGLLRARQARGTATGVPISIDVDASAMPPIVGAVRVEAAAAGAGSVSNRGGQWWRAPRAFLDPYAALWPFLSVCAGSAVGGIVGACALLFAVSAGRGWHGLAPPRCARCGSLQRGTGDALPERCAECGSDPRGPGAAVFIRRRVSLASLAVTVPITLIGGAVCAIILGALTERGIAHVARERAESNSDRFVRLIRIAVDPHDERAEPAAREALQVVLWFGSTLSRASTRDAFRLAHEPYARHPERFHASHSLRRALLELIGRSLDRTDAEFPERAALLERLVAHAGVTIPHRVTAGAQFWIGPQHWFPIYVETTLSGDGLDGALAVGGAAASQPNGYALPDVGVYAWQGSSRRLLQPSATGSPMPLLALGEPVSFVHTITVVPADSSTDEPTTDAGQDPFERGPVRLSVTVVSFGVRREVRLSITQNVAAPLVGRWEVDLGDCVAVLPPPAALREAVTTTVVAAGPMPERVRVRFVPLPWSDVSYVPANGEHFDGPRWAEERTIDVPLSMRGRELGRPYGVYSHTRP